MMKNKALKQYIEESYNVKIKKVKIYGLYGTLIPTIYYVIARKKQLDLLNEGYYLQTNDLFESLSDILDYLKRMEKY